jgi:hypothetical protein
VIYFQRELQTWRHQRTLIDFYTEGIVRWIGRCLHGLMWLTLPQWVFTLLPEDRRDCFTEWYVFGVLIASVLIYYFVPDLVLVSAYFSASTLVAMLHIVFLQRAFGPIKSAERSLVLFMFNVVQIVVMFATLYQCHYSKTDALLKSVLTFATISYADKMPWWVVIAQIATDFLLLAIFLGFVIGRFGAKDGGK